MVTYSQVKAHIGDIIVIIDCEGEVGIRHGEFQAVIFQTYGVDVGWSTTHLSLCKIKWRIGEWGRGVKIFNTNLLQVQSASSGRGEEEMDGRLLVVLGY